MQEKRYDGTDELTSNPTDADILRAVHDRRNRSVSIHRPGEVITTQDGRRMHVAADGSLEPLNKSREKARRRKQLKTS